MGSRRGTQNGAFRVQIPISYVLYIRVWGIWDGSNIVPNSEILKWPKWPTPVKDDLGPSNLVQNGPESPEFTCIALVEGSKTGPKGPKMGHFGVYFGVPFGGSSGGVSEVLKGPHRV